MLRKSLSINKRGVQIEKKGPSLVLESIGKLSQRMLINFVLFTFFFAIFNIQSLCSRIRFPRDYLLLESWLATIF